MVLALLVLLNSSSCQLRTTSEAICQISASPSGSASVSIPKRIECSLSNLPAYEWYVVIVGLEIDSRVYKPASSNCDRRLRTRSDNSPAAFRVKVSPNISSGSTIPFATK